MLERLTQKDNQFADWQARATDVLAQTPEGIRKPRFVRRPLAAVLTSVAFVAGVAVAGTWTVQNPQAAWAVAQAVGIDAAPQAEPVQLAASPAPTIAVPSRLQMSYQIASLPAADMAKQLRSDKE